MSLCAWSVLSFVRACARSLPESSRGVREVSRMGYEKLCARVVSSAKDCEEARVRLKRRECAEGHVVALDGRRGHPSAHTRSLTCQCPSCPRAWLRRERAHVSVHRAESHGALPRECGVFSLRSPGVSSDRRQRSLRSCGVRRESPTRSRSASSSSGRRSSLRQETTRCPPRP